MSDRCAPSSGYVKWIFQEFAVAKEGKSQEESAAEFERFVETVKDEAVPEADEAPSSAGGQPMVQCPRCIGDGAVYHNLGEGEFGKYPTACPTCEATGEIRKSECPPVFKRQSHEIGG